MICKNTELAAVVSFGIGCANANMYGIYTSLFNYIDWIDSVVGCPLGYGGLFCDEDIDECILGKHRCQGDARYCLNTEGSYQCSSETESYIRNFCEHSSCGINEFCQTTDVSFECDCLPGFIANDVGICTDDNECDEFGICGELACSNLIGGYKCSNETEIDHVCDLCSSDAACTGSSCRCKPGFDGDGFDCTKIKPTCIGYHYNM